MPASERDHLISAKKRLQEEAKALPSNPSLHSPENVANGVLETKQAKIEAKIKDIDARLEVISKEAKK